MKDLETAALSLVNGDILCYDITPEKTLRGIPTYGLSGIAVGCSLICYGEEATLDLHQMIVANHLLKAAVTVDGELFPIVSGSILARVSYKRLIWSLSSSLEEVSWSGNDLCKILRVGRRTSGYHLNDGSHWSHAQVLAVLEPGAQLKYTSMKTSKTRRSWRDLLPFTKHSIRPNIVEKFEFGANFDGRKIEWFD